MPRLTIDGRPVEVEAGTTILQAAKELGIEIPTFCYHPGLEPYGACRICSVELDDPGRKRRLVTACNYPVEEGMVVLTESERVVRSRKMILELYMARNASVPLIRELAARYGIERSRFGEGDDDCILCGLCVRVCADKAGARAIGFADRGIDRKVVTPYDRENPDCMACGACVTVCPTGHITADELDNGRVFHHELELAAPRAIRTPSMQAVPRYPFIEPEECLHFVHGKCDVCSKVCPTGAIDYEQPDQVVEFKVGNIILATGFQAWDPSPLLQYGYKRFDNVITALEFELLSNASGPTGGKILLADGRPPKSVAILHCIGSRDKNYHEYCSRVCCMFSLKIAHLVEDKTGAEVYNFYIDMRTPGKMYEEFYSRLLSEGIKFVRGKAAEVTNFPLYESERDKLIVRCEDTLTATVRRIPVDMVILSPALAARNDSAELQRILGCGRDKDGWFIEKHPKLDPVATATEGVFVAGCCVGPKDIPDSVAQGAAAASRVLSMISAGKVVMDGYRAEIDPDKCCGCRVCNDLCPYDAISYDEERKISEVNEALCKACGVCVAACPSGSIQGLHFTDRQVLAELEALLQ